MVHKFIYFDAKINIREESWTQKKSIRMIVTIHCWLVYSFQAYAHFINTYRLTYTAAVGAYNMIEWRQMRIPTTRLKSTTNMPLTLHSTEKKAKDTTAIMLRCFVWIFWVALHRYMTPMGVFILVWYMCLHCSSSIQPKWVQHRISTLKVMCCLFIYKCQLLLLHEFLLNGVRQRIGFSKYRERYRMTTGKRTVRILSYTNTNTWIYKQQSCYHQQLLRAFRQS